MDRLLGIVRLGVCRLATRRPGIGGTRLPSWTERTGERGSWLPQTMTSGGRRGQARCSSAVDSCSRAGHPLREELSATCSLRKWAIWKTEAMVLMARSSQALTSSYPLLGCLPAHCLARWVGRSSMGRAETSLEPPSRPTCGVGGNPEKVLLRF